MAAASSDVSGSKSGKGSARLANGEDYEWALGRYTDCLVTGIRLVDGVPVNFGERECDGQLVIERLGDDSNGLTFQATVSRNDASQAQSGPAFRRIYEGVGSYNRHYSGEIEFYADHKEQLVDGTWVILPGEQESDVSTIRVSQLDGDCSSVVADVYENGNVPANLLPGLPDYDFQLERIGTILFTDVDSESE